MFGSCGAYIGFPQTLSSCPDSVANCFSWKCICNSIQNAFRLGFLNDVEKIQMRATKLDISRDWICQCYESDVYKGT